MAMLINGEPIPDALVDQEFEMLRNTQQATDPAHLRLMAACAVVDRVLLRQAAERDLRPIAPEEIDAVLLREVQRGTCRPGINEAGLRRAAEQELRMERVMKELCGDFPRPSAEEVTAFYRANAEYFGTTERAEASHVIVHINEDRSEGQARRMIEEAEAELAAGRPFADVAETYSDCKGKGGDLGWFDRGVMVDEFDEAVFALEPGGRSGIFRTPFGFHIAELRAKAAGGPRDPALIQHDIESYLTSRRRHEALQSALDGLRESATIERVAEPVPR